MTRTCSCRICVLMLNNPVITCNPFEASHIPSKKWKYSSLTILLSCSRGQANSLPLMLRAENTDTSFGLRICLSVRKMGILQFYSKPRPVGDLGDSIHVSRGKAGEVMSIFLPPAELRWTNNSSSVEPSLSATALMTSLPVAATAMRIVVYVWSLQYTFKRTRDKCRNTWQL